MKIGFDAKRRFNNFTGLGNYSRFVLDTLLEADTSDDYYLYTPKIKDRPETKRYLQDPRLKIITPPSWMKPSPLAAVWRSTLPIHSKEFSSLDIYHGLSHELPMGIPSQVKTIVTIHDLIFLRYPQFYSKFDVMMHFQKVKHACRVADRIIAVSEQTAKDIIHFLKADPAKIKVIYQGCHRQFRNKHTSEEIAVVRKKYDLPDSYVLMVGSIESRKNAITLLKAFAMLPKDGRPGLVLVGKGTTYLNEVKRTIAALNIEKIDGVLLDLGVSSPQVDEAERGFSFRADGPLDMRMDTTRGMAASEWLATATQENLEKVIRDYGEERFAFQIAKAIVARRAVEPLVSTRDFAALVASAVKTREKGKDPATRTFQAVRIFINQELEELEAGLNQAYERLAPFGRLVVISFHSLEDRIVKRFMADKANVPQPHRRLPVRAVDLPSPLMKLLGRVKPSEEEIAANPRSRSAVMRCAMRLAPGGAHE
jgi:16S rRNA (cytosine1402-N4)-methyltransferase